MIVRKTNEMSLINIKNSKQGRQKHLPRLMGPHMGGYSGSLMTLRRNSKELAYALGLSVQDGLELEITPFQKDSL